MTPDGVGGVDLGAALAIGLALMLVLEGLLPFVSPASWRQVFERALQLSDQQLRVFGLASMLFGLALLLFLA